jgi:hypothetical protein
LSVVRESFPMLASGNSEATPESRTPSMDNPGLPVDNQLEPRAEYL